MDTSINATTQQQQQQQQQQKEGEQSKKKGKFIHRHVAPSKAPARVLKKQIRSLERLLANTSSDPSRSLPEEKVAETKAKILALQKQLQDLPVSGSNTGPSSKNNAANNGKKRKGGHGQKDGEPSVRGTKGLRARELRRAGRKIVAFKKQHPNYEDNEEEAKAMADLELDLLYIKHFPKNEPYISIYPDEPHEDEKQITQAEIRQKIADAVEKGEIRHGKRPNQTHEGSDDDEEHDPENPVSNWSDDDDNDDDNDDNDEEEDEKDEEEEEQKQHMNKKTRTK
ncbi:hypothetical protein BGW41_005160 [Actinomortierella wolfii]|nr:hypothetical protein BGW41_005160 [Actinomortierella wolfii]